MQDITSMPIAALSAAMARGDLSAQEIALAFLARMDERENATGAYITITREQALAAASAADAARRRGPVSPLCGIPAAFKDNLCTRGTRTTCASKMLEAYCPPYDAAVIEKMCAAHVVPLGKTNMDEFGMGSSTETSALVRTRNPLDLQRVPGGSSGGSAAAVAAGEAAFALGSDSGGSVRQPAAYCGLVGMKPTYGAVSRYGLVAFASSLDQVGPITRTVEDSALVLEAIAGHDPRDATSVAGAAYGSYAADLLSGVQGLKIALPPELFCAASPDVARAVEAAARRLEQLGAVLTPLPMPPLRYAMAAYTVLSSAETASNLARFDGIRYGRRAPGCETLDDLYEKSRGEGFGAEVKRRILLGTLALSPGQADACFGRAQKARALIREAFARALADFDLILSPATPTIAPRFGESSTGDDICTVAASLAGLPALSLPCGTGEGGMPVGLQLIGRAFDERTLYRAGHALEREGWR